MVRSSWRSLKLLFCFSSTDLTWGSELPIIFCHFSKIKGSQPHNTTYLFRAPYVVYHDAHVNLESSLPSGMRLARSAFRIQTTLKLLDMLSRLFHIDPFNRDWMDKNGQSSSLSFLFDAKNRPGYEKTLLYGPELSGKTSLLFELAMSFADEGKHVLFICRKKISKLPLLAQGRTQPTSNTLNYVQIVYLDTREEYLNYMSSIHFLTSLKFNAVIVDGIDAYLPTTIKKEDLSIVARVMALTMDAFLFQKSKQM